MCWSRAKDKKASSKVSKTFCKDELIDHVKSPAFISRKGRHHLITVVVPEVHEIVVCTAHLL